MAYSYLHECLYPKLCSHSGIYVFFKFKGKKGVQQMPTAILMYMQLYIINEHTFYIKVLAMKRPRIV